MRGHYNGCSISVYGSIIPGASRRASIPVLSKKARQRIKWFDYYKSHNHNARLTYGYFGISPQTFYRWRKRYNPYHLESLEEHPHRPKHLRQPTASPELVRAALKLREEYPRWGKDKLVMLVSKQGFSVSTSMVGRITRCLKDPGVIRNL